MTPFELNKELINKFPQLTKNFEEETSWQDGFDTGSITVFEDIFMPYVIYCIENDLSDEIKKIFGYIEECTTSSDSYKKTVVDVAIIENIHSYDIAEKIVPHLLPASLKAYNDSK